MGSANPLSTAARALTGVALAGALAGCAEEPTDAWTRAVRYGDFDGDGNEYYAVAYADREADQCIVINLSPRSDYDSPNPAGLSIQGADFILDGAWSSTYRDDCQATWINASPAGVTGTVALRDFDNAGAPEVPCSLDFDLRIEVDPSLYGAEGPIEVTEFGIEDLPILAPGCPNPLRYFGDYSDLDGAWAVHNGVGNLIVATWDAEREVCVWARFLDDSPAPLASTEVEAPDAWVYSGLRFARSTAADCVAQDLVVPLTGSEYASDSAPALSSMGTLSFTKRDAEGTPCTLDVDLDLRSYGRFDWTPDAVRLQASAVPVAGACE